MPTELLLGSYRQRGLGLLLLNRLVAECCEQARRLLEEARTWLRDNRPDLPAAG